MTFFTTGTQSVTATDTGNGAITGTQSGIIVTVAQSHFSVVSSTNLTAGGTFAITVTAVDAFNNVDTGYTGTVTFTSGDPCGTMPPDATITGPDNGTITVSGAVLRTATTNQTITATDTSVSSYTGSQTSITVSAGSVNAIAFTGPASITAGGVFSGQVTAYDGYNNVAPSYTGTIVFTATDPDTVFPNPYTFTGTDAGSKSFGNAFKFLLAGNQNLIATDSGNNVAATLHVAVAPASTTTLVLSTVGSVTAGGNFTARVLAEDNYGNVTPSYRGTVAFTSGDANWAYPPPYAFAPADNGNRVFNQNFVFKLAGSQLVTVSDINNTSVATANAPVTVNFVFKLAGSQLVTVSDINNTSVATANAPVTVNPAALARFSISAPATVNARSLFIATITGMDAYGNTANTYTGNANITSTDPNGTPSTTTPVILSFASGSPASQAKSGLLLNTGGDQNLWVRDAVSPNTIFGVTRVHVNSLTATALTMSGFPTTTTAGTLFNVTITAYDNYGDIANGYTGTVTLSSGDPCATLPNAYTFIPSDNGTHTFNGAALYTANTNQWLRATDANGLSVTTSGITVNAGSPNYLTLTAPASGTAGTLFSVTAKAFDQYQNPATSYTGTITFTSSTNPNAYLPTPYTFTGAGDGGSHAFSNGATLYLAGAQNITITDTSGRTALAQVSVTSANANALNLTMSSSTIAGAAMTGNLVAVDRYGNLSSSYRGTVGFTSSDPNKLVPPAYTFGVSDGGNTTFTNGFTLKASGAQTITATDANAGAHVVPAVVNITVSPNTTTYFTVTLPASAQPSYTFSSTVASYDYYNNPTPSYAGTVNLKSTDTQGTPSNSVAVPLTFGPSDHGSVTVNTLRLKTPGTQTITATDSGSSSITGSKNITIATQSFTLALNYNTTVASNYTYDANIVLNANDASLKALYATAGDTNSTSFAAATTANLAWDGNNYMRLGGGTTHLPTAFYSSLEEGDPNVTWRDTLDTANGGTSNVGAFCCGFTGPQANPNASTAVNNSYNSLLYAGSASAGGTTKAFLKVWSVVNQNILIDANSVLQYWIYPQSNGNNGGVSGSNSLYTALNVVFTDGYDTLSSTVTDSYGVLLRPASQGAGGHLTAGQWNLVRVSLAPLAGKVVDHISIGWQRDGANGGYRGFIDQVYLGGVSAGAALSNSASLSSSWTPHYGNLVAYWPLDGAGRVADGASVGASGRGPTLTATNTNGGGLAYVPGKVGQALTLDGVDDYLTIPSSTTGSGPVTIMFWVWAEVGSGGGQDNSAAFSWGNTQQDGYWWQPNRGNGVFQQRQSGNQYTMSRTITKSRGGWQHVAMTAQANLSTLYVDGHVDSTITGNPVPSITGGWIGNDPFPADGPFPGRIDEVAVWNTVLTANEINLIYKRQLSAYSGTITSRVFLTPLTSSGTNGLEWNTTLPAGKFLTSNLANETSTDYASLYSDTLMNNMVGLWHFEETALGSASGGGDFYDDTGLGNNANAYTNGTTVSPNRTGIMGRSIFVPNSQAGAVSQKPFSNLNTYTANIWFKTLNYSDGGYGGTLMAMGSSHTALHSATGDRALYLSGNNALCMGVAGSTLCYGGTFADNRWHMATATLSASGMKLYADGGLVASNGNTTSGSLTTGYWHIGGETISSFGSVSRWDCNDCWLDEAAVWSRALADQEIAQLYRRSAAQVWYQVRFCTTSNCADAPTWNGPDATANTYFYEGQNKTGTAYAAGPPFLNFATVAPSLTINPTSNPYVQYRAVFTSEDTNTLCNYGSAPAPCSAEVEQAQFYSTSYDTSAPGIVNISSAGQPYYSLASFAATLGSAGCSSGVKYILSPDGVSYYYYNGSSWVSSNQSASQSNTAAALGAAGVMAAFSNAHPNGTTYIQALLQSNGITPCALANVTVTGAQ